MNINDIVEFKESKNRYRIAGFGQMKDPTTGNWLDSVVYESFQDYVPDYGYVAPKEVVAYIRELKDFSSNFEPSIPKIQIIDSSTSKYVYNFGVPEILLAKYFDLGYGLGTSLYPGGEDHQEFSKKLAWNIMSGKVKKDDTRIDPKLLEEIKKDIKAGKFSDSLEGLTQIQNLLYFLCIPGKEEERSEENSKDKE